MIEHKKIGSSQSSIFSFVKYEHLVAGVTAGATSTLILHPLDLIKIRFSVNDGTNLHPQYGGIRGAFTRILRTEGVRGLYGGVTANLAGSASAWGLYFLFYNTIKGYEQNGDTNKPLGPVNHMIAASQAGLCTLVLTNPIWVVKTRLCLQYDTVKNGERLAATRAYSGMFDALAKIYRQEGVRGLYRGFVPGIFGVSHGAIQFMVYEEMKNRYNDYRAVPLATKMSTFAYLTFSSLSKITAVAATYPYQVVRARFQDQYHSYASIWDCVSRIWTHETWRGFYKGMGTNLLRVTPATMITFVTYEHVSEYLRRK